MTDTSAAATVRVASAAGAPTAPSSRAATDLPPAFESALQNMLRAFGDGRNGSRDLSRDPPLSAIAGAALLLLQKAEQSLASIAGAAAGGPENGLAVTVGLDPQLHKDVVGQLEVLTSAVSTDQQDLASTQQQLIRFEDVTRARHGETEHRLARLDEHLGHLRAGHETLVRGAAELAETVQRLEAVILRDHGRFTEELAVLGQRIEALEHKRKGV